MHRKQDFFLKAGLAWFHYTDYPDNLSLADHSSNHKAKGQEPLPGSPHGMGGPCLNDKESTSNVLDVMPYLKNNSGTIRDTLQ